MRWQLPVYSPLDARTLLRSVVASGPRSRARLRERLAERYGVRPTDVVLTASGTQALGLALGLTDSAGSRSRVALPAYTCWDVGTAAQWAGVSPVYYDVDPDHLVPEPRSFEAALESGVAAAVVSPLYGYPVDWDALRDTCRQATCLLVEDAAQGHGSSWRGTESGSFGDLTVLSFGRGKGWTGGGGGALLLRSPPQSGQLPPLAEPRAGASATWLAASSAQAILARPALYWLPAMMPGLALGVTRYHPPRKPRMMSVAVADLVLRTEQRSDAESALRQVTGAALLERLHGLPVQVLEPVGGVAGFLRLAVRIRGTTALGERSVRRLGIERGYPRALPDVPDLQSGGETITANGLEGARLLARELHTLPTHSLVRSNELDRIVSALSRV